MAETKRETTRAARRATDEAADMASETARESGRGAADLAERGGEAGHKVERLAERQAGTLKRAARVTEMTGERAVAAGAAAWSRSGEAVADGLQEAGRIWVELAQDTLKRGMQATEQMLRCRTLSDVIEAHNELLRSGFDTLTETSQRLTDVSARILAAVAEPVGAHGERSDAERADQRAQR